MIEAKNIFVKKSGKYLLHDISVEARAGEVLAVLGANGAGKSTLLKVIAGALTPDKGTVHMDRKPLASWKKEDLAKRRGVLSQAVHLSFPMSVGEVVSLGRFAFAREESTAQRWLVVEWALEQVDMLDFMHRDVNSLSGGEQQRIHLARVLAQIYENGPKQTKYLLLDEPVASLDIARQHQLLTLVNKLAQSLPIGVVVVLHDMNLAARYSDRIILLKQGKLIESGPAGEVLVPQAIYKAFGVQTEIHRLNGCSHLHISVAASHIHSKNNPN